MDESSTTMALPTQLRKRSISSHLYTTGDNENRTTIRTKIQKIDGQYKASSTCPVTNEPERVHSCDDPDEPQIIGTVPPAVPNSSKYRTRQDNYDDESDDDQRSNASSTDISPVHQSQQLSDKSTTITIPKPNQSLNDNENETTDETSVHIPSMSTRPSTRVLSEEEEEDEDDREEPTKANKKSTSIKSSTSTSSITIRMEQNSTR